LAKYDFQNAPSRKNSVAKTPEVPEDTILRFLAYYKEGIPEGVKESVRVRRVAVLFHIRDNTLLVREANQINSGLSQGVLVRRQRIMTPKDPSVAYGPSDFYLGAHIVCYGTTYCIVDMDERTRKYYGDVPEQGLPWPEEDVYNTKTMPDHLTHKAKKQISTVDMDLRRQMEFAAAGGMSKHHPDDVRAAQQFLTTKLHQNLQFAAIWDDRERKHGDCRLFVVKYYLENDTVELCESRKENCGREQTSNKFVGRQRVIKPNTTVDLRVIDHQHDTFGLKLKSHYLTHHDLFVGAQIVIHNKSFTLYDADTATREWYQTTENKTLADPIDVTDILNRDVPPPVVHVAPPYNGYGTEEDSLQNWAHILLRPAKKDIAKLAREDGKVMRFSAVFYGSLAPEDEAREFVVNYYRATDEIEIVEVQVRNSGHIGGKFLAKGTHGVKYNPDNFYEGAVVTIQGRQFKLIEMDAASKKAANGEVPTASVERIRQLITLFRDIVARRFYTTREAFRAIAPDGFLTVPILVSFLAANNTPVTLEEAASVIAHFDTQGSGRWPFGVFHKAIEIPNSFNMDVCANRATSIGDTQVAQPELIGTLKGVARDTQSVSRRKELTNLLREKLVQRRSTTYEVFRLLAGSAPNATMSEKEFRTALVDLLHLDLKPCDLDVVAEVFFPSWRGGRPVTLRECDFIAECPTYLSE
jgi:hypothetical protein